MTPRTPSTEAGHGDPRSSAQPGPAPVHPRAAPGGPREVGEHPRRTRWLLLGLGWIFFGLGAVGAVLPVLPTTPFMLLALWAFSKSSPRFHDWLRNHRLFGPPLQRWDRDHVIPIWARVVAIGSMAASLGWMIFLHRAPWYAIAGMAAVMLVGVVYVARFPTRPPRREP